MSSPSQATPAIEVAESRSLYVDPQGSFVWLTLEASESDGGHLHLTIQGGKEELQGAPNARGVGLYLHDPAALAAIAEGLAILAREADARGLLDATRARWALKAKQ